MAARSTFVSALFRPTVASIVSSPEISSSPTNSSRNKRLKLFEDLEYLAKRAPLTTSGSQSRWGTIAEAAAFSPVHDKVVPEGVPENPNEELIKIIRRISSKAPSIVKNFDSSKV